MSRTTLEFLPNDANEKEGLSNGDIELFRDDPYASCGRESGQNSRDASVGRPVKLTFDIIKLKPGELPFGDTLATTIEQCLAQSKRDADHEKLVDFFTQAKRILSGRTIDILRIEDYSTTGLSGPPDEDDTPFHALVKSSGVSRKESGTSGGSFGIGKNASFAVSDLQTVLYSTIYEADGQMHFAAQGRTRLVSHRDTRGRPCRATGYWGSSPGFRAITDKSLVPHWMRRTSKGTSIFCVGFRTHEHWSERIAYSIIVNFFAAIHRGDMVFEINGGAIQINHQSLERLFQLASIRSAAEEAGHLQDLELSEAMYQTFISSSATTHKLSIKDMGQMSLRILVKDGMPKRVGIIRNGMLITTGLGNFGDKLERFRGARDFVAVLEPADSANEASSLLKRLENPKHEGFSAERLSDPEKRKKAETAMRSLAQLLRETISSETTAETSDEQAIEELAEFFATPPSDASKAGKDATESPDDFNYSLVAEADRPNDRSRHGKVNANSGGRLRAGRKKKRLGDSDGPGTGKGHGGTNQANQGESIALANVRNLRNSKRPAERTIFFTPSASGLVVLQLSAPGISAPEVLNVASTTRGSTHDGRLQLQVHEGERVRIEVTFAIGYTGPLDAAAWLVNPEIGL